jgi:hypothetical protein
MGAGGQRHTRPRFAPGKGSPVPIAQEAGWASEQVWTQRLEEKSFAPAGDRTPKCAEDLGIYDRPIYNTPHSNLHRTRK